MLNPKMMRRFWLTVPAIAWAMLTAAHPAIAIEGQTLPEPKSSTQSQAAAKQAAPSPDASLSLTPAARPLDNRVILAQVPATISENRVEPNPMSVVAPITEPRAASPVTIEMVNQVTQSLTQPHLTLGDGDLLAEPNFSASSDAMAQMPSASQFTDVSPTDWAYEALQFLISDYECLSGYPDGTFQGDRALTRYEFAAALNLCLAAISGSGNGLSATALDQIERLQAEFQAELPLLAERIEVLEARTDELEANQFSTTTVLRGLAAFNVTGAFAGDSVTAERNPFAPDVPFVPPIRDANNVPSRVEIDQPNIVLDYLLYLSLITSFTGTDQLVAQLAIGNGSSPANEFASSGFFNTWGAPFLSTTPAPNGAEDTPTIRELFYSFSPIEDIRVTVGPRVNFYRHFDNNRSTFFITGATSFNSNGSTLSNAVDRGAGAVVAWTITPQLQFSVGYPAQNSEFLANNSSTDPSEGLFGGTNTLTGELVYSPSSDFSLRLLYTRTNLQASNGFLTGEPIPYGFVDDGFGGAVEDATADTFIVNFDWAITDGFGLFGRYSYGSTNIDPVDSSRSGGNLNTQSIQLGLAFPDLGKEGALGVFSFLIPHDYLDGRRFLLSGGGDGGTQYELEFSYYYPLTGNISIIPAFYTIINPNNFDSNPTVFVGNIRTQLSF